MRHDPEVVGPHDPILSITQFSSTLAKSCVAIFCHNLGASTLSWRRHRLNENLLSTHSNIASSSNPDTSRWKAEIVDPWVLRPSVFCRHAWVIERHLDVHACHVHRGADHTAMPQHGSSVIITCKCWQLMPSILPTCNFFQLSGSFLFQTKNNARCVPFDITDVTAMAL